MQLNFRKVTLQDKAWVEPLLKLSNRGSLEYNFTTIFVWRNVYNFHIAQMNDYFLLRSHTDQTSYLFPAGQGDLKPIVQALAEDADKAGHPLVFNTVLPDAKDTLDALYPGKFTFETCRDTFDYVYDTQSLATLKGKKLSAKRNHINRFLENHPDWQYEQLNRDNLDEARQMNKSWCIQHGCEDDLSISNEHCAAESAILHFDELNLDGGLIRTQGKVVAISIGDPLNDDTYLVHFEKAFADIQGAYPMINQQFVQHNCLNYKYVNREDDAGEPGLRRAKMSYRPMQLIEKYVATLKEPL